MKYSSSFKLFLLTRFHGLNRRKISLYLTRDRNLDHIFHYSSQDLMHLFKLPPKQASLLFEHLNNTNLISREYETYKQLSPITLVSPEYPSSLRKIPDPPLVLYWRGNKQLFSSFKVSVIGTRQPSPNAQQKIDVFLAPLISLNTTIVSGLAYGIDIMAHQYALEHHGSTIAVLGFGFDYIYPYQHKKFFQQISKDGLVISEYPPQTRAQKWHFPERNRIISGLSSATLIIEAAERSGTMITADQALEQGKEVFAIPDSIFLNQAQGCLKLIQEGATPLVKPEEIVHWIHENASILLDENV